MTRKQEVLNSEQPKRIDSTTNQAINIDSGELSQKEIIQRIREKSQIEGKNEGFKSLHR
jgi:hypothetical protein